MGLLLSTRRALMGAVVAPTYADKVLSYSPIIYFPMDETAGVTAVNYGTLGTAANGTYTGVTLANAAGPSGETSVPFFDGANDYLDFFSAAFDAAFNGATGTAMVWAQAFNAGVWTDGSIRYVIRMYDDANNAYLMDKGNGANAFFQEGEAGAGLASIGTGGHNPVAWTCYGITWSDGNNDDQFKAFIDGAQTGATSAALNNWSGGGLTNTATVIGALNTGAVFSWHGWMGDAAVFDYVLTPAQILDLATV